MSALPPERPDGPDGSGRGMSGESSHPGGGSAPDRSSSPGAAGDRRRSRRRSRRRPRPSLAPGDNGSPWAPAHRERPAGRETSDDPPGLDALSDSQSDSLSEVESPVEPAEPAEPAGEAPAAAVPMHDGPLVHVAFRGGRVEAYVNPKNIELRDGDRVIVEAERGVDLGRIVACQGPDIKRRKSQPLRAVVRPATQDEIQRLETISAEDREALEICRSRAERFRLKMKVIDAETQFDGNRVTFYFTADHRVDFRELVRDLASIFRTRIELRQVGARDAARRCDGMGLCGRQLCCNSFLREFEPVTLKMAKEQSLSLNPTKISGNCGRLMCCLIYECAAYQQGNREAPGLGSRWVMGGQVVTVRARDVGNRRVIVEDESGKTGPVDLDVFTGAIATPAPRAATADVAEEPAEDAADKTDEAQEAGEEGKEGSAQQDPPESASRGDEEDDRGPSR
jgi:cell fate regulator YaaT (PSP1 superfamily)